MPNIFEILFSSEQIIDLQLIMTDMVDLNITEEERNLTAYYDQFASTTAASETSSGIPDGKLVI